MILNTEAVVLHTRRFSETSLIVTFFTRDRGKLTVLARGAFRPKSKYASVLQPMGYLRLIFYWKEGRDLQTLSSAETIERFQRLTSSLERMTAGLTILELVNACLHDDGAHQQLFDDLVAALQGLDQPNVQESAVTLWFMVRLANELGYALRTDECGVCDELVTVREESVPYSISMGAPLCAEHTGAASYRPLPTASWVLLRQVLGLQPEYLNTISASTTAATELYDAMTSFIKFHVEGMKRLRVSPVAGKILAKQGAAITETE